MLAIAGTADEKTQSVIVKQLLLKRPQKLYVSPNRENLRISVIKCKRENVRSVGLACQHGQREWNS